MEGWIIIIAFVAIVLIGGWSQYKQWEATPPNPHIVCKHCGTKGTVKTRQMPRKKGISGGKATGALMTGGLSMGLTGLSRKQTVTEMTCTNCKTVWDVE